MRWLRALWLVGFLLGTGCFHIDCDPKDDCPGHAVYPGDWNLSECACPLRSELAFLDGSNCTLEGMTCVDDYPGSGLSCTCVHMPAGARVWSCGRDMAVTTMPLRDLATVDDAGPVDGSASD